jgi:16S rRNA (guanine527-N7)-methyltransferase
MAETARIEAVSRRFGESVDPGAVSALIRFSALFLRWNGQINLAAARTGEDLIDRHFADAFAARRFVGSGDRVADVGTGGGLPAIPLALLRPLAHFDLFEPIAKKVAFLRTAVRELALGDRVQIHARSLGLSLDGALAGTFDLATSRATFAPADWLPLGRALVRPEGRVLVFATTQSAVGLPLPDDEVEYDPNRRLLMFSNHVP